MSKRSIFMILLVLVFVIGIGGLIYVAIGGSTYSEGSRVGYVTKFTKKGTPLIGFKTWEGELNMGAGLNMSKQAGTIWEFSVVDESVVKKIDEAQSHGTQVKLHYVEQLWGQPWKGKTNYFVTSVEEIKP